MVRKPSIGQQIRNKILAQEKGQPFDEPHGQYGEEEQEGFEEYEESQLDQDEQRDQEAEEIYDNQDFLEYEHEQIRLSRRGSPGAFENVEEYYSQHPENFESRKLNQIEELTRREREHIRAHLGG